MQTNQQKRNELMTKFGTTIASVILNTYKQLLHYEKKREHLKMPTPDEINNNIKALYLENQRLRDELEALKLSISKTNK